MPAPDELEQIARDRYDRMAAHYWRAGIWAKSWEQQTEGERNSWRRSAGQSFRELVLAHFREMKKGV